MPTVREFIEQERAKGTPDDRIYDALRERGVFTPEPSKEVNRGLIGEIIPTAGAILGGIGGGALGAFGGPAGAAAGYIAGSGLGGAAGEFAQQGIEKATGERQEFDEGQIAASGVISAAVPAALKVASIPVKAGAKAVANVAREPMVKFLKFFSGYADDVIHKTLQRTPGAVEGIKGGEKALNDIVRRTSGKISELASSLLKESQKKIAELSKLGSFGGPGQTASRNLVLNEGRKFIQNTVTNLQKNYNIGVRAGKELLFSRSSQPSRIVVGGDQKTIQEGFNLINNVLKNTSIKNIDATLERMIVLQSKTPGGTPTGATTKKIIREMMDELARFAKATYPKYGEFLDENFPKRLMLNEAKELFGSSAHLTAKEVSVITKRLLQIYNTGNLSIREGVEKIGKEVGEDVAGTAAGAIQNIDDAFSFRGGEFGIRNLIKRVAQYVPRKALDVYVETGKITGELGRSKGIRYLTRAAKVSTQTAVQMIASLAADKEKE